MAKLRKSTLSDKLQLILERDIRSGKHVAGRRMPSTRVLAEEFGVSQQVVKSAFSDLEGKGLVVSLERDGVYVNPEALVSSRLEFSLLTMRRKGHVFDYVGKMLSTGDSAVWDGVNLASRNIASDELSEALLSYELDKIKDSHPDCLVASIPAASEKFLAAFETLKFPVVFIGDFPWLPGPDFAFSQIVEDTSERGEAFVDAVAGMGARSLALVGGRLDNAYAEMLRASAAEKAESHGIEFRYAEFRDGSLEPHQLGEARSRCMRNLLAGGRPDAIAFDGFIFVDIFLSALRAEGLEPGRDILAVSDRELLPGSVFIESDARAFSLEALSIMKGLAANPGERAGRKVLKGLVKRRPLAIGGVQTEKTA